MPAPPADCALHHWMQGTACVPSGQRICLQLCMQLTGSWPCRSNAVVTVVTLLRRCPWQGAACAGLVKVGRQVVMMCMMDGQVAEQLSSGTGEFDELDLLEVLPGKLQLTKAKVTSTIEGLAKDRKRTTLVQVLAPPLPSYNPCPPNVSSHCRCAGQAWDSSALTWAGWLIADTLHAGDLILAAEEAR